LWAFSDRFMLDAISLRTIIVAAASCVAALVVSGNAGALTDSYDGIAFYPFTMDASNADCVPYVESGLGATRNCDPINIIFPGQSMATVVARLHAAGWIDTGGSVQWLHFSSLLLVPVQWQLAIYDNKADPTQRYHVRLWQVTPTLTIGNVHHEHGTPHRIDISWDAAQDFLAGSVCAWWCDQLYLPQQSAVEGDSGIWRGWENDGYATVVPASPPSSTPSTAPLTPPPAHVVEPARKHRRRIRHRLT
jgi:hypothetical protein